MTSTTSRSERRRLGAFYTPSLLVDFLVEQVVRPSFVGRRTPPLVIDPACGDGRLLVAAGQAISAHYGVDPTRYIIGAEINHAVAQQTASRLGCEVLVGDARQILNTSEHRHAYDVVIGNPPYLSQLATPTARGGRSLLGGGQYADVAAEFLALSARVVRTDGGRVGLVLPISILATSDVAPIRSDIEDAAAIDVWWWSDVPVFDANVRTCIIGLVTGMSPARVRRFHGTDMQSVSPVDRPARATPGSWSWLVADAAGIPDVDLIESCGVLGDIAMSTADFRDQYYGLVGAVGDDVDGPPLITSGLIDAGINRWGLTPTRFAKVRYLAPRVNIASLDAPLHAWATRRLVPKVLVASQTRVVEAVVDEHGAWLPSVPVVTVIPRDSVDLWRVAAILTSPVASAWLAQRRLGSGLSAHAIRVTAKDLQTIPLPNGHHEWHTATTQLRNGDVVGCGRSMLHAYGLAHRVDLAEWWERGVGASRVSGSTVKMD